MQQFSIPVGQHYTGSDMRLFIANDHDTVPRDSYGTFRNVRVCEGACPADDSGETQASLYFVHTDHLGTPQLLSDWQQNVVWTLDYTPFGEVISNGAEQESSRFPGQYFDVATGVSYNYYRDYDPGLGRYLQSDPMGLVDGPNTYGYGQQNPLKFIDPFGLYGTTVDSWCRQNPAACAETLGGGARAGSGARSAAGAAARGAAQTDTGDKSEEKQCDDDCPPCNPPVGTQCYRTDFHFNNYGVRDGNLHYHIFVRGQKRDGSCECVWNKNKKDFRKGVTGTIPPGVFLCDIYPNPPK